MNNLQHTASFPRLATLGYVSTSASVGYEIHEFLAHEARFLDHGLFDDWITLLDTELVYRCPGWVLAAPDGQTSLAASESTIDCDFKYNVVSSHARSMRQVGSDSQADVPVRRLISNVIVAAGRRPKEFIVHSYVLITGAPHGAPEERLMTVERQDILRRCSRSFRLLRRELRLSPVARQSPAFALIF